MLYGIAAALAALFLAALLSALLRTLALRLGAVERRQGRLVALLGGPAVIVATAFVAGAGDWTDVAPLGPAAGRLLVAGVGVGALGLVADLRPVPLAVRGAVVTAAAALTVPFDELGLPVGVVAVGWIVLIAHAFTSLDHADGVMGTVAVVTAFALSGSAAAEVMDGLATLLSVLAAALTGFLMHGWPPARIVPGRCGGLFAGFVLASAAVLVHAGRETGSSVGAVFALTVVATADAVLVLVSRRRAGRPLLCGAADHLVHRLRHLGVTPQGAAVLAGVTGFAGALVGMLIDLGWVGAAAALWVAGGAVVGVVVLLRVPVYGTSFPGKPQVGAYLRVRNR
ncbi:undecaprenyl/decaprenyl-phosphate alpha-N-acetylglucosaminyl 1-phosphate transferase [Streptomyces sp. NBC_01571]|uniref:MraY family glycosyltransferase n=1 Tax=Streptomyces sp. NBC_01571 TaxID=2975883 RepID=UPI0022542FAE|nr:MraY family glycosyltransferase [Streptomyces sp. NBC_01571]MCX4576409.1 undecaprenyl/decaprenyl-phosphate alpha-N-acetylglucosaminyl 1-phosphate transferase [Streptomyces sp. NBC_01571]